jgi:hypothetical protein
VRQPQHALDVPCPLQSCMAQEQQKCRRPLNPQSSTMVEMSKVHESRLHKFERAVRDWRRLEKWIAGEMLR